MKNNNVSQLKLFTLILSISIVVFSCVYFNKPQVLEKDNTSYVAYYLDDNIVHNKPLPTDDVAYDHATCDNNATITFDVGEWKANIKGSKSNTKCKVYFVTNTNAWQLPGGVDLETGMTAIKFVDGKIYKADTTQKWYDYRNSEWANAAILTSTGAAKTTEELDPTTDIYQMYVWIPRYGYKTWDIVNGNSDPQIISIEFLGTNEQSTNGYVTHPAFKFGQTELNGIWVAKFEASIVDENGVNYYISTANSIGCSDENCSKGQYVRILPNYITITRNNIKNMFYISRSIENASVYGLDSTTIDTHMMKNIEWGAVAYLSQSRYGIFNYDKTCKNTNQSANLSGQCQCQVYNNNVCYGTGTDGDETTGTYNGGIAGCSATTLNNRIDWTSERTGCEVGYSWNENGVKASTTGNVYGIYDMSGGNMEYVMANFSSSSTSYVYFANSSGITTELNDKYLDKYLASTKETSNDQMTDRSRGHLGDATYEVIKSNTTVTNGSWNNDYSRMCANTSAWLARGGRFNTANSNGIFGFDCGAGSGNGGNSFRIVLTKE